jgi:hypothetical protein
MYKYMDRVRAEKYRREKHMYPPVQRLRMSEWTRRDVIHESDGTCAQMNYPYEEFMGYSIDIVPLRQGELKFMPLAPP